MSRNHYLLLQKSVCYILNSYLLKELIAYDTNENMKRRITKKDILFSILFIIFLYVMIVLNLFKSTKKLEWNIFASEDFPQFLLFCLIVVPLIYAFTGEKKEKIEQYKKENEDSE